MTLTREQSVAILTVSWFFGFFVLLVTKAWVTGIFLLLALTALTQGLTGGHNRAALQAAFWLAALGLWAALRFNVAVLFAALGLGLLIHSVSPGSPSKKPYFDDSLE
ncbi:MAG: hypothetical protein KatS3mg108_0986 [Isosphaeraceae bacterium]|jgi:type IV secretory pathway VirB2 component (pilin)|nr:MAG: hypothetical protein KatS3mg108_0986 [Isosphaeraceae bacterium]